MILTLFTSVFWVLVLWLELVFLWGNTYLKPGKPIFILLCVAILIQSYVYVAAVNKMFPC